MKNLLFLLTLGLFIGCQSGSEATNETLAPESSENKFSWKDSAVIYEVNIRQYTEEGTFKAFQEHLPRLKDLGVDVLWLMPIHPIGVKNRKGGLGSYYSIQDYKGVNPEFGTEEDFKALVDAAHAQGMKVILDWVANHSAWDNPWVENHPDWYTKDSTGKMISPWDWTDVVDLNYDSKEMRQEMISSLKYWMTDFGVDGYRCDVAFLVPTDFWEEARKELSTVNEDVFMLAEAEEPEHHNAAFDASYGWAIHHFMNQVAQEKMPLDSLVLSIKRDQERFPKEAFRMMFTSNHDENSWNGTTQERMGDYHKIMTALCFTLPNSFPLIYSGQETGLNKRLSFFEKDTIVWSDSGMRVFYSDWIDAKHGLSMLYNGSVGAPMVNIKAQEGVLSFKRENENGVLHFIGNFSAESKVIGLEQGLPSGKFVRLFNENDGPLEYNETSSIELKSYEYVVLFNC